MARGDEVALAANWRTVLAVDAALGVAIAATGIVVAVARDVVGGWPLAAAGVVYVVLVVRRHRRWRRLRDEAGLTPRRPG